MVYLAQSLSLLVLLLVLLLQICLALSVWRVPHHEPELYKNAEFKLSRKSLYFSSAGLLVTFLAFLILACVQNVSVALLAGAYGLLGLVCYKYQQNKQESRAFVSENIEPPIKQPKQETV